MSVAVFEMFTLSLLLLLVTYSGWVNTDMGKAVLIVFGNEIKRLESVYGNRLLARVQDRTEAVRHPYSQ